MIAHFLNYLFFNKEYKTQRVLFYPTSFETVAFSVEREKACLLCGSVGGDKEEEKKEEGKIEGEKETTSKETPQTETKA